ncbi:hypothetical protein LUZ63_013466 [Rhynchospora breviuscula]|uniref:EF-hand domain-containing protein n=1 Tax=Rhynchospora breviuscula TaxID=2022672 RepID=A0A9Q0C8L1_9POAL|nr:hypothetical protein LUZ63_013466 [Rhynchospora breviuscula]
MEQFHYLSFLSCTLLSNFVRLAKHLVRLNSQFTKNSVEVKNRECDDDGHCDMYLHDNDAIIVMELLGLDLDTKHVSSGTLEGAHALLQEKESSVDELKQAFAVFDTNGDGFITARELMSVMNTLRFEEGMEIEDCERMIGAYDKDSDGKISFEDFKHLLEIAT